MITLADLKMPDAPQSIEMVALHRAIADAVKQGETASADGPQRSKTWDLPDSYHGSILGACLSPEESRQLLIKLNEPDARKTNDHIVHSRLVRIAARRDAAAKLLNKSLDRKHEDVIRKVTRMTTVAEIRQFWRDACAAGDVAGAYWAVLTHPAADLDLMREAYGEVVMLSHRFVRERRQDLLRMEALEAALAAKDEKLARQESRLSACMTEQAEQKRQIDDLQAALLREKALRTDAIAPLPTRHRDMVLETRLADERARADLLEAKLAEAREALRQLEDERIQSEARATILQQENDLVEAILAGDEDDTDGARVGIAASSVLYVGGRRRLYDKLRALAAERGVTLLLHDGGMEDNTTFLPTFVAQAEMVIFPVDHISHAAAGIVKRLCREGRKPYIPLRSAGLTSFVATISNPVGAIA